MQVNAKTEHDRVGSRSFQFGLSVDPAVSALGSLVSVFSSDCVRAMVDTAVLQVGIDLSGAPATFVTLLPMH